MKVNGDLKFRTLGSGELQNAIIERLAGGALGDFLGEAVSDGRIAYNTDTQSYWYYAAGAVNDWVEFGAGVDLTNIINSGGYMNGDGTFDPTVFTGFINISPTGSPMANLVDALAQLDAAVTVAAGVDTLKELTDVNIDGEGSSDAVATGQILFYKDGTEKWTHTSVTALSDGDILVWDNGNSTWKPENNDNVAALPDLTDVTDTTTSGASDGQILRFDSGAGAGNEWSNEDLEYITQSDGDTYISTTGSGAINPRVDGNGIWMYIDTGSAELVAEFISTKLDINSPVGTTGAPINLNAGAGTAGAGGAVNLIAGAGVGGAGGGINIDAGDGDTTEGGDIILTAGDFTTNSGEVILYGGGTSGVRGSVAVGGAGGAGGNDGGNVEIFGGNGSGTDGHVWIYSGSDGSGTGDIIVETAGTLTLDSQIIRVQDTNGSQGGILRFYDADQSNYTGWKAEDVITGGDVIWGIPEAGGGSPDDAVYVLGTDSVGTGTNPTKWVSATSIGGNSFDTWANSGGTTDANIIATTTSDTVTLVSGGVGHGINLDFNATTDTITYSMVVSGLTDSNAVESSDKFWFSNGGTTESRTVGDFLNDLNVVHQVSGSGIVVQSGGSPQFESRTIIASSVAGEEGLTVTNGDGVAGNPTIGLDITGLADAGSVTSSDTLAIFDGTNNLEATVAQLTAGIVATGIDLGELKDVTVTTPTVGDIIVYQGGSPEIWVNEAPGAVSGVQPYDAVLQSISDLTLTTCGVFHVADGSPETVDLLPTGTSGRTILSNETVSEQITHLGLDSGGVNDIWVDVAGDTMTGDLDMSGGSPQDSRILLTDGVVGTPSLTYANDADTGLYRPADNELNLATGGADRLRLTSTTAVVETAQLLVQDGSAASPGYGFEGDAGKGMYNIQNDVLGFAAGAAERLRIYGTNVASGSPDLDETGAISVEATAAYETLIGDPTLPAFDTPVDDFLPNAQWVDLYYLKKSGGTMTGDLIMSGPSTDINLDGGKVINVAAPTDALDAANKAYVDSLTAGLLWIDPVWYVDLVRDDVGDATGGSGSPGLVRDLQTPANDSGEIAGAEDSDMYIIGANGGGTTLIAVGTTGNLVQAGPFAAGTVVRFDADLENGNVDPVWQDLGHISTFSDVDNDSGGTRTRFGITTLTDAPAGGTFAGREGYIYVLQNHGGGPAGSPFYGSPAEGYNATWVADPLFLGSPEGPQDTYTFLVNNPDSFNAFKQFTFIGPYNQATYPEASSNKWVQIGATASIVDGVGLSFSGNTLNVNLGAGIVELPGDEVGIELYNPTAGALILTDDGTTRVTTASSTLHLKLDVNGGLDQGTAGLRIADSGIDNDMLENNSINFAGDAGTPADVPLGGGVTFDGTDGVVVTVSPGGSPLGTTTTVTVDLDSVPNSALAFSSIGFTDGTNTEEVALGTDLTVNGGIVSATDTLTIRRIEDADGDTYVETSTGVADDGDVVSIVAAAGGSGTFNAAGVTLSGAAVDIDSTTTTVAIDAASTVDITGATGATVTATTGDLTLDSIAASLELKAATAVEFLENVELRLHDADDSHYIGHKSNAVVSTSITYEWPEAPAGDDYVLVSSTGGVMSWASPSTVGRTRIEDLDDVVINKTGSPETYIAGDILVASGGSPTQYESQQIQYIYDSTLTTPVGSPQTTASTTHAITHNLGQKYVNVTVYNSSDQQIIPQGVTLDSANALTVTFNSAIDCVVVIMGVPGVTPGNGA